MATEDKYREIIKGLLSRGLITKNQITKALEYQCRLPPGQYMPLTKILVEFDYITEEQLKYYLGQDYETAQDPIGRILVSQNIVSQEQLDQALEILNSFPRSHVSDVLIDMGFASREVIHQAISRYQLQQSNRLQPQIKPAQDRVLPSVTPDTSKHSVTPKLPQPTPEQAKTEQAIIHLPLGRFLIARGYLSEDELRDALEYQQRLPRVIYKPIGEVLIALGYITRPQLEEALAAQPPRPKNRMGEILIRAGIIQEWQLSQALSLQFSSEHAHKKLGTILVEQGYTSREEIELELSHHGHVKKADNKSTPPIKEVTPINTQDKSEKHKPLGEILLEKGFVSQTQLQEALEQQALLASEYKPLGDTLVLMGHITEAQLQIALSEQKGFEREPLGQILIKQGIIKEWQLSHALCVQFEQPQDQRQNLGSLLVQLNYTQQDLIEEAMLDYYRHRNHSDT